MLERYINHLSQTLIDLHNFYIIQYNSKEGLFLSVILDNIYYKGSYENRYFTEFRLVVLYCMVDESRNTKQFFVIPVFI